jgi:formate hydrogenlyase subunit 4
MSGASLASAAVELAGGILVAPLLPGLVQHWKARLQGRRGPTPLQPYRELRRLWGKSAVDARRHRPVYRLAPASTAASLAVAVLLVPVAATRTGSASVATSSSWPACSRSRASRVAAAAWDVGNGFSLMGASRDLTIAVFGRGDAGARVAVAALIAGTTNLRGVIAGTAGTAPSGRTRRLRSARSPSRSSSSPRPDASRSTTPTRISS